MSGGVKKNLVFNEDRLSVGKDEKVLEMNGCTTSKFTYCHRSVHLKLVKMINSMFYILYHNKKCKKSQWLATMCVIRISSKISEVLPWIPVGSKFKILLLETVLLGFTQFYLMKQEIKC